MALWDGLVGKWRLASSTWTDTSGKGNNLSASVSAPTAVAGLPSAGANNGANFVHASSQYLHIADASQVDLDLSGSFTISCWIKPSSLPVTTVSIISKSGGAGSISYWLGLNSSHTLVCAVSPDGTAQTTATGVTVLQLDTVYHVFAVYNGTDIRIYINNILDSNGLNNPKAYTGAIVNNALDFCIGRRGDLAGTGFTGVIDDVAVFNVAKSTADRTSLYTASDNFALGGTMSGTITDMNGTAVDCSSTNVRVNVYPKNNTVSAPIATLLVSAADGTWEIYSTSLDDVTLYLVTYEYEGYYAPLTVTNMAGAEFKMATA